MKKKANVEDYKCCTNYANKTGFQFDVCKMALSLAQIEPRGEDFNQFENPL